MPAKIVFGLFIYDSDGATSHTPKKSVNLRTFFLFRVDSKRAYAGFSCNSCISICVVRCFLVF